ncbi:hypothetical protein HMN09_01183700 [Mycena chlorophos]|uniref:F-box domain-containing protein n=1 Tax=Mycena chlorophos TaxID=658473 RepID=A0A8H6S846_MYCCL|nr:hypothetical protein HMN09_01183700 [Mycena chlorophos]
MSPQAPLPPELVDLILACISHPTTLRTCSLVCRAWVPSCRSRDAVFTLIFLGGRELDIDAFLAVIGHPDPEDIDTIRTYVRRIHLVRADYWQDVIQMQELLELLPTFTALREISMQATAYTPLEPFFPVMPLITHLALDDTMFRNFGQFIALLKRLPGLRHLSLAFPAMGASSVIDAYPPELHSLAINWKDPSSPASGESQLCSWISRATTVADLTLTVADNTPRLQAYLQSLQNLVCLHLQSDDTVIDLGTLPHLRYLHLGTPSQSKHRPQFLNYYAGTMPATLERISTHAPLETLVLDLHIPWERYNASRVPDSTFQRLQDAVDALIPSKASLRVLHLDVHCHGHTEVDEEGALPAGHFHPGTRVGVGTGTGAEADTRMCFPERMVREKIFPSLTLLHSTTVTNPRLSLTISDNYNKS